MSGYIYLDSLIEKMCTFDFVEKVASRYNRSFGLSHFKLVEYFKEGYPVSQISVVSNGCAVLAFLDVLRDMIEYPIIINSGLRSPKRNADVGGAKNSLHLYGLAVDIKYNYFYERFFRAFRFAVPSVIDELIINKDRSYIHIGFNKTFIDKIINYEKNLD